MRLYYNNKSTINIAHNPMQHDQTKHIEIDRHFIKEKLDSGLICIPYVSTEAANLQIYSPKVYIVQCFKQVYPSWK